MKILLFGIWNVFSVLLIILLKILCGLLYLPLHLIIITFGIIGGYITVVGNILGGLIFIVGIATLIMDGGKSINPFFLLLIISMFAALPILMTHFFEIVAGYILGCFDYILKQLRVTGWLLGHADHEYDEANETSENFE